MMDYIKELVSPVDPELAEAMGVTIPDDYVAIETAE